MTDLISSGRMCWPYSPESFATCLYAYLCPENSTFGVKFSFPNLFSLPTGEDLFKSWYHALYSFASDAYSTVRSYSENWGTIIFVIYLGLLIILGTIREFSYSQRKRAQRVLSGNADPAPEPAQHSPIIPLQPTKSALELAREMQLSRYRSSFSRLSFSSSSSSVLDVASVARLPNERFSDFLSIFDLAKTSHVPGNTDLILSRLNRFAFPLDWRCPSASMTLLHCALLGGDVRLVKRLVDAGSDVHARNAYGDTCLYLAVYTAAVKGFVSTPKRIVDWKEEMEEADESTLLLGKDSENTNPNLLNESVLDLLIESGADVNAGNHDGHAPLHYAASVGNMPLVTFLLNRGGRPEAKNRDGFMPAQVALNNCHLKTANLLQREIGRRLREESKQLEEERNIFMKKMIAKKAKKNDAWRSQDVPRNFCSDMTHNRSSGSTTFAASASSFSIPRSNDFDSGPLLTSSRRRLWQ